MYGLKRRPCIVQAGNILHSLEIMPACCNIVTRISKPDAKPFETLVYKNATPRIDPSVNNPGKKQKLLFGPCTYDGLQSENTHAPKRKPGTRHLTA